MINKWQAEGVSTNSVLRVPTRLPGFHAIRTDARGERQFHYWRDQAPARDLFNLPDATRILESLPQYKLIYLSGISLLLYDAARREKLHTALTSAKADGTKLPFKVTVGHGDGRIWQRRERSWRSFYASRISRF